MQYNTCTYYPKHPYTIIRHFIKADLNSLYMFKIKAKCLLHLKHHDTYGRP